MVSACFLCLIYSSQQLCKVTTHILIFQLKKQAQGDEITQLLCGRPKLTMRPTPKSFMFIPIAHTHAHPAITHPPTQKSLSCTGSRKLPGWGHANSPASWSCMCWSLIEGEEDQPMSQWLGSLGKSAFGPLLQPSPFEMMGPERLTAGGMVGLQCPHWWYLF